MKLKLYELEEDADMAEIIDGHDYMIRSYENGLDGPEGMKLYGCDIQPSRKRNTISLRKPGKPWDAVRTAQRVDPDKRRKFNIGDRVLVKRRADKGRTFDRVGAYVHGMIYSSVYWSKEIVYIIRTEDGLPPTRADRVWRYRGKLYWGVTKSALDIGQLELTVP